MRKCTLIILSIFCLSFFASAQGWVKDFPSPNTTRNQSTIQTEDGNYLSTLVTFGGFGSGNGPGSYIVKFDESGDIIWMEKYSDTTPVNGSSVFESPDGGYFIKTYEIYSAPAASLPHIRKLNANFEETAASFILFNNNTFTNNMSAIIVADDNHFFVGGSRNLDEGQIRKYDFDLNLIWEITTPHGVSELLLTAEGDIVGTYSSFGAFKMDLEGNIIWETDISNLVNSYDLNIHQLPDGTFTLFTAFDPSNISKQIKISSNGQLEWAKEITPPNAFALLSRQAQVTDGFISSGFIESSLPNEFNNLLLLKTDFDGNVIWQKNIHLEGSEYCRWIAPTDDNGAIGITEFNAVTQFQYTQCYGFRVNSEGNLFDQQLTGKVGFDMVGNCDISDATNLSNWIVSASNEDINIYASTDSVGNYKMAVPTGILDLEIHPPNSLWNACEDNLSLGFVANAQLTQDFTIQSTIDCPTMAVQSVLPFARPCFDNNTYYVSYCNEGTVVASDAYIVVSVDPELSYVNSTISLESQNGDDYTFSLGDIPPGECGNFQIDFLIDCDTEVYETVCISTEIYPNDFCDPNPIWSGAFVEGSVDCEADSVVFSLINEGTDQMSSARSFIVIEDALILNQGNYELDVQEEWIEKIPANGSTLVLEAMQEEFAPGDPYVKVWIEGCGENPNGEFSTGIINQFSLGDNNPTTDKECRQTTSSFDPNDKQGFPIGFSDQHYIRANTDIEYLIRFQNTGNDTAFTVVLLDTIAPELDLTTVRVGPASHDYEWKIEDDHVMKFTFNSILLPDSTTNFDASNGFVKFVISQQPDLPNQTIIRNNAGIYFDFNEVIMTNETYHKIGMDFIAVSTQNPIVEAARIEVSPNPFRDFTTFKMKSIDLTKGTFELYDLSGKRIFQQEISGPAFIFSRQKNISAGNYFYRIIDQENGILNSGQISIQ